MRLNETKRKQRTSQEEVLAEMFAEAELQDSVRKKKNWDAWMESEVEQQIDEEIGKYLAESSDPTVYLTPKKEAKAWNLMPKSKQQRLLQKESQQVFKEWQAGERKAFAGAERRPDDLREDLVFLQSGRIRLGKQRTGMAGQARIWKRRRLPRMPEQSKGNVRSVPERMQRESGNAKTGRTGGMGQGVVWMWWAPIPAEAVRELLEHKDPLLQLQEAQPRLLRHPCHQNSEENRTYL